jgi:hypothetical protein
VITYNPAALRTTRNSSAWKTSGRSTWAAVETGGSGFATFDPDSGVFSTVGHAFGSTVDVRSGPIVTLETNQRKADIWLTSNFLLDYQYQLSASLNPAFQTAASATETISVKIDLLLDIDKQFLVRHTPARARARSKVTRRRPDPAAPVRGVTVACPAA